MGPCNWARMTGTGKIYMPTFHQIASEEGKVLAIGNHAWTCFMKKGLQVPMVEGLFRNRKAYPDVPTKH